MTELRQVPSDGKHVRQDERRQAVKLNLRLRDVAVLVMAAFAFAVGVQLLRLLMVGLVFYLREVREFTTIAVGGVAFLVFASVFVAPAVVRVIGARLALFAALAVMACARLAEQLVASPAIDLVLVTVGVAAFLPMIPLALAMQERTDSPVIRGQWRLGLLLGLALDTTIKGGFATLDTSWHPSVWADIVTVVLTLSLLALAVCAMIKTEAEKPAIPRPREAFPLLALGPWLFLEMLLFQNIAGLGVWSSTAADLFYLCCCRGLHLLARPCCWLWRQPSNGTAVKQLPRCS